MLAYSHNFLYNNKESYEKEVILFYMKQFFKLLKPFDYLIIVTVICLSFIPSITTYYVYQQTPTASHSTATAPDTVSGATTTKNTAIVKIDGKEVDRFELSGNAPQIEKTYYPHEGQYNIIERKGTAIRDREDNSPDQIAVKTGWIFRPGQVSICLPHGLIIEIHGEMAEDDLVLPK